MVLQGQPNTVPVTVQQMIYHPECVAGRIRDEPLPLLLVSAIFLLP